MSPAIPAATSWPQMYRWIAAADRRAGAWRAAPHERACAAGALAAGAAGLVSRTASMLRLAPGRAEIIDEVPSGRIHLDGRVLVAEGEGLAKRAPRDGLMPA